MRGTIGLPPIAPADRWVLPFVCATAFAVGLNATMLGVALPGIARGLSLDPTETVWVVTAYFLANGVAIPFFGRLAGLRGLARVYAAGLLAFLVGSTVCLLAPDYPSLIVGRLVQGAGAAAVVGLAPTAVASAYPPQKRGVAIGVVGAAVGVAYAVGPVLGGLVTGLAGWRPLFLSGVLFGSLALVARRALPPDEPGAARKLDWPGGLLLGAALASGLLALTEGSQRGWDTPLVGAAAGWAALCFAGFVARQRRARDPFVPRSLLRNAAYVRLGAVTLLLVGVNITVQVTLPLPLAEVGGLRPPETGLALLPPALATVACGPLAGALVDRSGVRLPILASASLVVAALFCLSAFGIAGPVWTASALAALVSVGATVAKVGAQTGISLAVRKGDLPSAISISEMLWMVGTSLGSALFAAIYAARTDASSAINPAYGGPTGAGAVGYSDAFLALAVPLVAVLLVSLGLTKARARP